jgi:hypothetical protein
MIAAGRKHAKGPSKIKYLRAGTWVVLSLYRNVAFPEGSLQVDSIAVMWLGSAEEDLKILAVRNWR